MLIHFSDVFRVGRWSSPRSHDDECLNDLKSKLPDYCVNSRAENTKRKYQYSFNAFCKWSNLHKLSPLPASDYTVSLYIIHLSESAKSSSKIEEVSYSISWAHKLAGYKDPCKSDLVTSVRDGAHRKLGHLVTKKEPITPKILIDIVNTYGNEFSNLKDIRLTCMCLLCYSGFLRFSELANLRRCDITFHSTHVKLFLVKSKTDIYREGRDVIISKTNSVSCPVNMLNRYLNLANIAANSEEYIFRSISYCKSTDMYKLRGNAQLSYTRAREILLAGFRSE